ncbi:type VI secretion system-associated protein TagF [Roseomonas sp. 18066]|uniref:type VI secretion system-associated protein TagF n=1 Tax=Roseomonas sp. 18066 TaxID=2681412 RepID=UPI0013580937|nr:type VI secretion system-associated protein TagF [Roseomonas sp. 18066]
MTGLFGKLPAHGDFVRRHLPSELVAGFDGWAAAGLQAAEERLGAEAFAARYDATPCWCLALPAGACGALPVSGVMAPGRDAVGRRFFVLLAAPVPPPGAEWFADLQELARRALTEVWDADRLAAALPEPSGENLASGWWHAAQDWPVPRLIPPQHVFQLLGPA